MICNRLFLFLSFLVFNVFVLNAQQFGGNPFTTKWRQINSDTARIIFPEGLDSLGSVVSGFVKSISAGNRLGLGNKLNKIDIVLQNQPAVTNGYVSLGPFRSELYTTPSSDNFDPSSLSWLSQLTVHEYRHVQQFNNFNNGLSGVMKKLFGQEGYALAINAAVPNWFFEGDAVYNETLFAPHGRGTLPFFLKAYPSLWQSEKKYSWMKLRNGSQKDYVPNHYDLGYLLVNYGSEKYGYDFWRNVTRDASAYKGLFYPMQKAVKKHAGVNYKTFRDSAFNYYKNIYGLTPLSKTNTKFNFPSPSGEGVRRTDKADAGGEVTDKNYIHPVNTKTVTNYTFPFQISENDLLYQKSSYNKRAAFYLKTKSKEELIRFRDISIEDQYSYRNGKIVYAAYETHPRWRWISYNVIKILDIKTGSQRTLKHETRYFSPDISEDGTLITANKVALNGASSLVILNAADGTIKKEITNNKVLYFSNPKMINNNTIISVLRKKDATTCISAIDMNTGNIENITPPSHTVIGTIDAKDDKIFFTASQHLKDELFYYDLKSKQLYKLPTTGVGSYFVNSSFGKISWSSFTANGYQLNQTNAANADWQPVSLQTFTQANAGIVADTLHATNNLTAAPFTYYASKPYRKLTKPVNFHSWRPNYSDPEFSFTMYGNNVLNTTETQLYYLYNENDKTHTAGGSITYGGLFPFITLGSAYTFNRWRMTPYKIKRWNEWNNYVGVNIPLNWTSNRTLKSLNIGSSYHYRTDFNKGESKTLFQKTGFSYLAHGISWAQRIQATVQDIYPRLGYSSSLNFRHTLHFYKSWQYYGGINFYLPGIIRTQSLVLNGSFQYSGTDQRVFGNRVAYARGYAGLDSAGAYTARANYHFTLFYPDWGFANIFYLQRVRASLFYDYTHAFDKSSSNTSTLQSAGAEIYFDTKWWNQHPLTFGFRVGTLLSPLPQSNQKLFFELVLPGSLIPR